MEKGLSTKTSHRITGTRNGSHVMAIFNNYQYHMPCTGIRGLRRSPVILIQHKDSPWELEPTNLHISILRKLPVSNNQRIESGTGNLQRSAGHTFEMVPRHTIFHGSNKNVPQQSLTPAVMTLATVCDYWDQDHRSSLEQWISGADAHTTPRPVTVHSSLIA